MTTLEVDKIINNVTFTMEVEGFHIPAEQKEEWRNVLTGKTDYKQLLLKYLEDAKQVGMKQHG